MQATVHGVAKSRTPLSNLKKYIYIKLLKICLKVKFLKTEELISVLGEEFYYQSLKKKKKKKKHGIANGSCNPGYDNLEDRENLHWEIAQSTPCSPGMDKRMRHLLLKR